MVSLPKEGHPGTGKRPKKGYQTGQATQEP